ncbi:MAG: hypothetical protein WCL06_09725 [Bacteroidota bacterium]
MAKGICREFVVLPYFWGYPDAIGSYCSINLYIFMKKIILLLVVCALYSCTTIQYGSTVKIESYGATAKVWYKSYDFLVSDTKNKAENQMWSNERLQSELKNIPLGGYVLIKVMGPTLASANTKYWNYIVKDLNGNEITSKHGEDSVPDFTSSQYGTTWYDYDIVDINNTINEPFKVYVIDELLNKKSEYTITPNQ